MDESRKEIKVSAAQAEISNNLAPARVELPANSNGDAQQEYEDMLEKELFKLQAKYDELLRTSTVSLEKDEKIFDLESQIESLTSKVSQMKLNTSRETMEAKERDAEFKKLQMKVAKIIQLFEEQQQQESDQVSSVSV